MSCLVTCTAKMVLRVENPLSRDLHGPTVLSTGEAALLYKAHIAKLYANPENVRSGNRW